MIINNMTITAYSVLLIITLAIFLFCYFVATRVWIKVDEQNRKISPETKKKSRRDFLHLTTISIGGIGTAVFIWPFLKSMNPAEDTLALGSTEVDLSNINVGQAKTVKWRGKPVFIRRRTSEEILEANDVDLKSLRHPENDKNTVIALKEIAENKVLVKELKESAINKLRKHIEQDQDIGVSDQHETEGDGFEDIYKGEVSKSGVPILPSKRARKIPEKIEIFKEELVQKKIFKNESLPENKEISLKELEDQEKIKEGSDELVDSKSSDNA